MKKNESVDSLIAITIVISLMCVLSAMPVQARDITKLHIGYQPSTHQIAHMTAMENGLWAEDLKKFGIVKVTDSEFPSGPPEMIAMRAGELDVAYVGTASPITAIDKGLDAKIVAGVQTNGSAIVLLPEHAASYTSPNDLKGLKIATFPPGSIQDTILRKWLMDNGLDPVADLEILGMGPGEAIIGIGAEVVDGVFLPAHWPTIIELDGTGEIVVYSGQMWPNHACCCLLVSDELIEEHPELVEQIVRTHINATEYNMGHVDEAAEIYVKKIVGADIEMVKESLKNWDGTWIYNPHLEINSTLEYAKVDYEMGYTDKLLTAEDLFDTSFYDKIMESAAPEPTPEEETTPGSAETTQTPSPSLSRQETSSNTTIISLSIVGMIALILIIFGFFTVRKKEERDKLTTIPPSSTPPTGPTTEVPPKDLAIEKRKKTTSGLFDAAQKLANEAAKLFGAKDYEKSLGKYQESLRKITDARDGAEKAKDERLVKAIGKDIYNVRRSVIACEKAIGSTLAEKAKKSFDAGNYENAISTYKNTMAKFEDALKKTKEIEDSESIERIEGLIKSAEENIENCHAAIDKREVENLLKESQSLHEKAAELAKGGEMFNAKAILRDAEGKINNAFEVSTKRKFIDAVNKLNTLLKVIRDEMNVIDGNIANGITSVDFSSDMAKIKEVGVPEVEILAEKKIDIKRGYEILQNNALRFGIRIINNTGYAIMDVETILDYPKTLFSLKGNVVQGLANISPNGERTAKYILTPLGCIHNEKIEATIFYKDHTGKKQTVQMRPKEVHCVCPFLKEKAMREGEFAELANTCERIEEGLSFTGISVNEIAVFIKESCAHRLYVIGEHETETAKIVYLAGESIGEKACYLLTAVIQPYKNLTQIALRAYSDKPYGLHGFLNEIASSIRHLVGSVQSAKEIGIIENKQVINIIDSVVQRTSFGGTSAEGTGTATTNIEGSVVQRTKIGLVRKCPNCEKEVQADEKFCAGCGSMLE